MKLSRFLLWCILAVPLAAAALLAVSAPAAAQTSQVEQLLNRINRLQQELTTLQSHVYRGKAPPPSARRGVLAGPQMRRMTARISVRIDQLEGQLRRLTGGQEEFTHTISQMQARLEKLAKDVEFRLGALERGGAPLATVPPGTMQPPAPGAAIASGFAPTVGPPAATAEGVLGTVPQMTLRRGGGPVPAPARAKPVLPKGTPKQQYDYAHSLIVKEQNFVEAERVLDAFIKAYPKNKLAPNAHYWLGRTYFVREEYQRAAFTFAEGFQKYPKSGKAPDNLLNLGMSLARLDKKKEACTAYSRLVQNFPKASRAVQRRVKREQKRSRCR